MTSSHSGRKGSTHTCDGEGAPACIFCTAQNGYLAILASRGFDSTEQGIEGDKGLALVMSGRPPEPDILQDWGSALK